MLWHRARGCRSCPCRAAGLVSGHPQSQTCPRAPQCHLKGSGWAKIQPRRDGTFFDRCQPINAHAEDTGVERGRRLGCHPHRVGKIDLRVFDCRPAVARQSASTRIRLSRTVLPTPHNRKKHRSRPVRWNGFSQVPQRLFRQARQAPPFRIALFCFIAGRRRSSSVGLGALLKPCAAPVFTLDSG